MARVTIEDCLEVVEDRFELVLLAAQRTRELLAGAYPAVSLRNDKEDILALREIAKKKLNLDNIRKNLMYTVNKVVPEDMDTDSGVAEGERYAPDTETNSERDEEGNKKAVLNQV